MYYELTSPVYIFHKIFVQSHSKLIVSMLIESILHTAKFLKSIFFCPKTCHRKCTSCKQCNLWDDPGTLTPPVVHAAFSSNHSPYCPLWLAELMSIMSWCSTFDLFAVFEHRWTQRFLVRCWRYSASPYIDQFVYSRARNCGEKMRGETKRSIEACLGRTSHAVLT